ncbi:hypermethylated in cancer 2 protein-like isoform X3 [Artemia franciscana]|uniref:hypermethylated in cancer 2 protein-like isoform X3 n=1 Tax=Artemia franciscana TaxID=6661 RepID=UPI0032DAFAF9
MSRHCCACDRKIPFRESVFYFPTNSNRRAQWLINSGLENIKKLSEKQLLSRSLCARHFSDTCFSSKEKVRLLKNAVPDRFENGKKDCQQCETSVRRVLIRDLTSRMTGMESIFGNNKREGNEKQAEIASDSSHTKVVVLIDPMEVQPKDLLDNFRHIEQEIKTSTRIDGDISLNGHGASCSTDFASIFIKQEEDPICQSSLPNVIQSSKEYQPGSFASLQPGAVSMTRYPCEAKHQCPLDKNQSPSFEVSPDTAEKVQQLLDTFEKNPVISEDTQTFPTIDNGISTERFGSCCSTGFAGIFIKQEEDSVCQPSLPSKIHLSDEYQHETSIILASGATSTLHYPCDAEQQYLPDKNPIHSSEIPISIAEKDQQLQSSDENPVTSKESTKLQSPCLLNDHMKVRNSGFALKLSQEEGSVQQPGRTSLPEIRPRLSLTDVGLDVVSSMHFLDNLKGNKSSDINLISEKKSLSQNSTLDAHRDGHMKGKLYQCAICMKQFFLVSTMAKHMRSHKGENGYECRICKTAFTRMYKLTAHMVIHTGGKLYECETCKKKFTFKSSLTRHISIHNGEKPYSCDICMKTFSRNSTLERHIRSHNGVKPHRCTICNKSFAENFTLTAHMKIHTGEKPYQCQICKKTFTFKSNLRVHVKTHNEAEGPLSTNLTFSTEQNDIPAAVSSSMSTELQPNTNSLQIGTTTGSEKETEGLFSTNPSVSTDQNDISTAASANIATGLEPITDTLQLKSTTGNEKEDDDSDHRSELAKERRREAHTVAEQKRRDAIKKGYDALQELVPSCQQNDGTIAMKMSKAIVLQKSIEYIQQLEEEKKAQEEHLTSLRKEVIALRIMKENYELIVEAHKRQPGTNEVQVPDEAKFRVFQTMMDSLFETFDHMVNASSFSDLSAGVFNWLEEHCKPQALRELVLSVMTRFESESSCS